jgi:hypothetical protein
VKVQLNYIVSSAFSMHPTWVLEKTRWYEHAAPVTVAHGGGKEQN